jgi:hypothetical protein
MAKPKKPYPGMGAFVVVCLYDNTDWVVYRGAATEAKAKQYRRELPQWSDDKCKVVPNSVGDSPA